MSTVPVHSALQSSVAVNNSHPDADPPDPGRHYDPMSVSLVSDMEVSSPDVPAPTLDLPAPTLHDTPPVSSSPSPLLPPNAAPLSYKDKLMASDPSLQVGVNTFSDTEEVTLVEGDVTRSTVDGLISIVFSERVQALTVKNFDLTVVVKLLGRRIGYNTLRQRLLDIWKPTEAFRLMDIENDYFLVTFKSRSDYSKAVSGDVCPVGNNANAVDTTTSVPPVIDTPPMTNEAFGPWMKVERRQRRVVRKETNTKHDGSDFVVAKSCFNPIFEDETADELADRPTTVAVETRSEPDTPGLPLPAATDSRGKGKVSVSSTTVKHRSPTSVRKPLVVQRPYAVSSSKSGPSPSRRNSSLSNTRFTPFPWPPTRLNKGNHSAVVVSESDDPVILTGSSTPLRVQDSSVAPLAPNTLLGVVKPPNLVEGHVQSLVQPVIATESQNAPSLSALPQNQFCGLKPQASFGLYFLTPRSLLALIPFQIVFRPCPDLTWILLRWFLRLKRFSGMVAYLRPFARKGEFAKAQVISSILAEFGQFSGHRVNLRKSQIYFSPNTDPATIASICSSFSIDQTPTLGNWIVGNGANIDIWNDTWVPRLGPLRSWLRSWSPVVAALTFEDLLCHERQWDVDRLSTLLLPDAIPFVIGIPPPFVTATDALSCNLTLTGTFSVSSAYAHLLASAWEAIDPKWSWVWSLAVTQRIRMFVWLILKQRLMTNEERCCRGLSSDASCSSCGCVSETIIHILRDCPPTRVLWLSIIPPERCASFFAAPLEAWVAANIRDTQNLHDGPIPWACFFPTLLWQLWKRRNDFLFTNTCLPLPAIHKINIAWAKHFAEVSAATRAPRVSMVSHLQWLPPVPGWSDCSHAEKLLTTALQPRHGVLLQDHDLPLVRAIVLLCQDDWQVDFQWIPRELNMVADCLAKLSSPSQFNLLLSTVIPEQVRPLLDRDREGPPYIHHSRGVT
ncbi:hypothetical protein V6N11_070105 [Hibiscus sabdariffa]|uniref:Reverse transcriptase zinc-binding domain-containing protein n=1 Tax=Hibiscus sabdariffa TaxID=183260 RepID=A0ABR2QEK2_9ROSI